MMAKLLFLLLLFIPLHSYAFQSVVVLPFSNESEKQDIYWLGEGFAESLSEEMLLKDAYLIQRLERKGAYEELRLPYVGDLSRATMLKIGKKLAADYVVFGSFNLQGTQLAVNAQVVRLASSELGTRIQATGALSDLYRVQASIREGLKKYFSSKQLVAIEQKRMENPVPLHAYELYIKGLLEPTDQGKIRFFQRAVEANPGYGQALYRWGAALARLGRYRESNDALLKVPGNGIVRSRADFLKALNSYHLRDYGASVGVLLQLSNQMLTAEVANNLGINYMKSNNLDFAVRYLGKAVQLDSDEPDYHFNLASCYFQNNQYPLAAHHYRESIRLLPNDYQAFYLLGKTLEKQKNVHSHRILSTFQELLPADQKGKFVEHFSSPLLLLRPAPSLLSSEEKQYQVLGRQQSAKQKADYVRTYQSSAKKELDQNDANPAVLEIKKGLTWAPLDSYLHYLWGVAYEKSNNSAAAISQYEFSLWCRDNIDSHISLAELYRVAGRYEDAKLQVRQIIALDPKNKKALEIWGKIWDKVSQ